MRGCRFVRTYATVAWQKLERFCPTGVNVRILMIQTSWTAMSFVVCLGKTATLLLAPEMEAPTYNGHWCGQRPLRLVHQHGGEFPVLPETWRAKKVFCQPLAQMATATPNASAPAAMTQTTRICFASRTCVRSMWCT